jgi:hypothetical protein
MYSQSDRKRRNPLTFSFDQQKMKNGPDWARTSDPALIKRML